MAGFCNFEIDCTEFEDPFLPIVERAVALLYVPLLLQIFISKSNVHDINLIRKQIYKNI